ncbi:MAG: class I SAM-dependent methyltransferase [Oscillatoriales cyanobacterium]|uniref:class I SAM-dependent methyltransferase n=2 Tax=Microcoleus TaxID=44471 RepID=UPI001D439F79|nr:class I SAM-dependent methyltransferase [Microcoleus sp. PH2017_10_PVI_O_A]TAE78677.1 MAG: class I SAM-dependent methyltransferase [Oscillatoriales cyanobacterium]TAE99896.1 MAG: class I SAM-dependent methyltransferase [Oscillatoriales cyanobacterium]TAF16046.1 MAG: class I SAM-dependent methyltransferase [Oscillatoriales cyanobacterium]TAF35820.1 MAG: class I SAM-dependent methyltransferase [Oscillatoriales cyanobacterium]TAF58803.1 MAG: class I SAM-dependent methyltransferase [Oscillatori
MKINYPRVITMNNPSQNLSKTLEIAATEAVMWKEHTYYDQAESWLSEDYPVLIEPLIKDCDFSVVIDLAAGHGRNSNLLKTKANKIIVVDIHQENIDFCKKRFAGDDTFEFLINDGVTLKEIADNSVTLVYSWDAMVHFDSDVVRSYISEFSRVLKPGGKGLCHHSNYDKTPGGWFQYNPHARNFMTANLFAHYCAKEGLKVLHSQVINWGKDDNLVKEMDCITLFEKPLNC